MIICSGQPTIYCIWGEHANHYECRSNGKLKYTHEVSDEGPNIILTSIVAMYLLILLFVFVFLLMYDLMYHMFVSECTNKIKSHQGFCASGTMGVLDWGRGLDVHGFNRPEIICTWKFVIKEDILNNLQTPLPLLW